MSEELKAQLIQVSQDRSRDALHGVITSEYQLATEESTVGPYDHEQLYSHEVKELLGNPKQTTVILCGRNELDRGNLQNTLQYAIDSTGSPENIVYVDGNSTDNSVQHAESTGVTVLRRSDLIEAIDRQELAKVLAVPAEVLEGKDVPGQPPLRKGAELLNIRRHMLSSYLADNHSTHMIYIDTDLKSTPHGEIAAQLPKKSVYHPLQQIAAATIELNGKDPGITSTFAIFTGSGNRNNEPHFAFHNLLEVQANSPFLNEKQQSIARAFFVIPSQIVHPLTGELGIVTPAEINAMAATGQCIESARILSLAGFDYQARRQSGPLQNNISSYIANVRRGEQLRIDEPQIDEKEWWMICGIIPQFSQVITAYAIQHEKLPHEFNLDDYSRINHWLSKVQESAILDNNRQTRVFKNSPMERLIPPVAMLHKEGLLVI